MEENLDKYYTELDKTLQNLAALDWPTFVQLVGEDAILAAKICLLRKKGKSYNQVAINLHITKGAVRWKAENCVCGPSKPSEFSNEMNAEFRKVNN